MVEDDIKDHQQERARCVGDKHRQRNVTRAEAMDASDRGDGEGLHESSAEESWEGDGGGHYAEISLKYPSAYASACVT